MEWVPFILSVAAGLALLFAGRRFFWLAAALMAFIFTFSLVQNLFGEGWVGLILAVLVGAVFAWLATKFIKVAGYIVGTLAGAAGLPLFLNLLGIDWSYLVMALAGAVVGFLLMWFLFDWGLILLTAWAGANAVAGMVNSKWALSSALATLLVVVLLVLGVIVQSRGLKGKK